MSLTWRPPAPCSTTPAPLSTRVPRPRSQQSMKFRAKSSHWKPEGRNIYRELVSVYLC